MRLPADKAVVRVAKAWGNRVAPMLRFVGRSLTMAAIVFAVAYHWFRNSSYLYRFDQREGWSYVIFLANMTAMSAAFAWMACFFAGLVTTDSRVRAARPVGWIGLLAFGMSFFYGLLRSEIH